MTNLRSLYYHCFLNLHIIGTANLTKWPKLPELSILGCKGTDCWWIYETAEIKFSSRNINLPVRSKKTMVIIEETVFKTQRPHHFNICCWSDRGEPCCLVKVLDILKFSSTPPCGPPQGSSFKIFQISHCPGPSDGYHVGHFFIWLTNEKSPTWV